MNRREFIATGSVTIASLALVSTAAIELAGKAGQGEGAKLLSTTGTLCRETFARCVDSVFNLHHTKFGSFDLTLSSLLDQKSGDGNQQFTLIFQTPPKVPFSAGTFVMSHPDTGYFPIYIESTGHDDSGSRFRADFNLA
jgi:hypothetical protein